MLAIVNMLHVIGAMGFESLVLIGWSRIAGHVPQYEFICIDHGPSADQGHFYELVFQVCNHGRAGGSCIASTCLPALAANTATILGSHSHHLDLRWKHVWLANDEAATGVMVDFVYSLCGGDCWSCVVWGYLY